MKKTQTRRQLEISLIEVLADLRAAQRDLKSDIAEVRETLADVEDNKHIWDDATRALKTAKTVVLRETLREMREDYVPDMAWAREAERDVARSRKRVFALQRRSAQLRRALELAK